MDLICYCWDLKFGPWQFEIWLQDAIQDLRFALKVQILRR